MNIRFGHRSPSRSFLSQRWGRIATASLLLAAVACANRLNRTYNDPDGYYSLRYPETFKVETLDLGVMKAPAQFIPMEAESIEKADRMMSADVSTLYASVDELVESLKKNWGDEYKVTSDATQTFGEVEWRVMNWEAGNRKGFAAIHRHGETNHLLFCQWTVTGEMEEEAKSLFDAMLESYQPVK